MSHDERMMNEQVIIDEPDTEIFGGSYDPNFVVPEPRDRDHAFEILSSVPALPYRHWCWPGGLHYEAAGEIARICGSIALSITWADESDVERAREISEHNDVEVCLQYSPWHHIYKKKDPTDWGPDAIAELQLMSDKFNQIKEWLGGHPVGFIELDSEKIRHDGTQQQKKALREKNDLVHKICKYFFPDANIMYHGHHPGNPHHVKNQLTDGYASSSFYAGNQRSIQKYEVTELVDGAKKWNLDNIVPSISMAGYYDMYVNLPLDNAYQRGLGTEYPVKWTWERAKLMWNWYFRQAKFAYKYGPTGKLTEGYFWPYPFNPAHTGYEWHFIAYCFGAHNHKKFENDWVDRLVK